MREMKHLANKDFYYVPHSGDRRRAVRSSDVAVELVKQWIIDGAYSDKLQEEVDEANRYGASNTLLISNHAYYKKWQYIVQNKAFYQLHILVGITIIVARQLNH